MVNVCVRDLMFSCVFSVRVIVCLCVGGCAVILCNCRCNCTCVRRSESGCV